jgi:chromatin assembly factor 1 subunit B
VEPQLWHVFNDSSGDASVSHLQSLSEHKSAVNAVRFDPDGTRLASGADSGELFLWTECPDQQAQTTEWRLFAKLLGHQDDLQDISWSPDGSALASASVENMCIVWDMGASKASQSAPSKNKQCMPIGKLPGHEHWVQGVAWDPLGELIATMCGDRCCRVYGSPNPRDINKSLKVRAMRSLFTCLKSSHTLLYLHPLRCSRAFAGPNARHHNAGHDQTHRS